MKKCAKKSRAAATNSHARTMSKDIQTLYLFYHSGSKKATAQEVIFWRI